MNEAKISNVFCPTYILHGKKDGLIPHSHGARLSRRCGGRTLLFLSKGMKHNSMHIRIDLLETLDQFFTCVDRAKLQEREIKYDIDYEAIDTE